MQFVLHKRIKRLGRLAFLVVVVAALLKHIGNLLVGSAFAGTNLADAFQQLVEIVFTKRLSVFQHVVVQHKALCNIFFQGLGCPYTESRSLMGVDSVADGYYGIEIIESGKIFFAVGSSCRDFLGN